MRRLRKALPVLVAIVATWGLTTWPAVAQDDPAPLMNLDLIVPAGGFIEGVANVPTQLCVDLPDEASKITLTRQPLSPDIPINRPLWVRIAPYISTAYPYVEKANVGDGLTLEIPELGHETCFTFENTISPREAQAAGRPQAYKVFAQVVTIKVW